jgi:hypothetical protein
MSLIVMVMVVGHMFLDGIDGSSMALYYPMSTETYLLSDISFSPHPYFSLSSEQTLLIIWGSIILSANLVESRIYGRHEGLYEEFQRQLWTWRASLRSLRLKAAISRSLAKSGDYSIPGDSSDPSHSSVIEVYEDD